MRLQRLGLVSFGDLLPRMRGTPPEVLVKQMGRAPSAASTTDSRSSAEGTPYEPHPLDYEWRFASDTTARLAARLAAGSHRVAVLGAPTVHQQLLSMGCRSTLFDRNPLHARAFGNTFVCGDLIETPGRVRRRFPVIFMDFPWYPDVANAWLRFAMRVIEPGGSLFLSMWPDLIRPTALDERDELLSSLRLGATTTVRRDRLRYAVPMFERLAYAELGLTLPDMWRAGDLVEATEVSPDRVVLPSSRLVVDSWWFRCVCGTRQIAIRDVVNRSRPTLQPVGNPPSMYLHTVSRRDPTRSAIDVWASNDAVAAATGETHFVAALSGKTYPNAAAARALLARAGMLHANAEVDLTWRHKEWRSR